LTAVDSEPEPPDVAADGSFLVLKPLSIASAPLDVVLDWRAMIGRPVAPSSDH